jgi:hypothetical protein
MSMTVYSSHLPHKTNRRLRDEFCQTVIDKTTAQISQSAAAKCNYHSTVSQVVSNATSEANYITSDQAVVTDFLEE